jgi:xanthine dehydrogenase iron-sulfur cluster and FAD-binding subunit A
MAAGWETYCAPSSLEEALRLLSTHGPEARIVAGGTDLLVELRRGVRQARVLVDVTRMATPSSLQQVRSDGRGSIGIGPLVTHNLAVASGVLAERATPLAQACWQVGTPQLRNRGTIVGNLVTASPANDTITALWALDAQLTLAGVRGERRLDLPSFYEGVRKTTLASDEMVTDIRVPAMSGEQRGVFVKLGLRRSHAIAVVNAAAVLTFDGDSIARARITLGSVAPTIIRAPEAEAALIGGRLSDGRIQVAAGLAGAAAVPIDDIRAGAGYRREMVKVLVRRALTALRDRDWGTAMPGAPPMRWGKSRGLFAPLDSGMVCHESGDAAIEFTVNGTRAVVHGAAGKTLLSMLRDDLGLVGTKDGCGEGECGACTVWMDGIAVLACLIPAPRAHGTRIVTVEGLGHGEELHPVQQAFIDEGAVQCGYCTPGFVMSGANLLEEIPHPTREQILGGLQGNLCRCTGYYKIVRALERAAESS